MKANFIYSNLNPCGGGERFTLATLQAVVEMGIEVDLTTLNEPNLSKLENAFGKNLTSVMNKIRKINVLQMFDQESIDSNITNNNYDLIINTHGDIDPYYSPKLSNTKMITYCHYPSAKSFIESEDLIYFDYHLRINRLDSSSNISASESTVTLSPSISYESSIYNKKTPESTTNNFEKKRRRYMKWVKETYDKMIKNSLLITNSYYSQRAIFRTYGIDDIIVLSPPVAVNQIRNHLGFSQPLKIPRKDRYNDILVICRIEPSKRIENAIYLAKLLKERKIDAKMIIAGSWEPFYQQYYENLNSLITDQDLSDNITFKIDSSFDQLIELMGTSKVYFHPREGEHFGISIVEAMSAGMVPVVPKIGGQAEFVSTKYQYDSLEQASQIIGSALGITEDERQRLSDSVIQFSETNYKRQFQLIVSKLIYNINFVQQYHFPNIPTIS